MNPLISIIVPSYKPQSYLWECLDSIRCQTLEPGLYEIIVVLNGCNEPYRAQIEDYIQKYGSEWNIRLIQTDTPGVSNARNIGIDSSYGEYLIFIDDDDLISDCFIEELLKVSSADSIGCSNSKIFSDTIKDTQDNFLSLAYKKCSGREYRLMTFRHFLSPPVCKMIHKSIIADDRFPVHLRKSEDSVFCMSLVPRIKRMKLASADAIYYQRKRKGSVMRSKNSFKYEFKTLIKLEMAYLKIWLRHFFRYNPLFVLTRMAAGFRNFILYIK